MSKKNLNYAVATTRTRETGLIKTHSVTYYGNSTSGSAPYSGTIATGALSGLSKTMTDVVTKGFSSKIRSGGRVNNPMSRRVVISTPYLASNYYHSAPSAWEVVSGPMVSWIMGRADLYMPTSPIAVTNLVSIATIKVMNGVEPAKSQSLVTVLEAHKSWETVLSRAKKIAAIVTACRSGNLVELRKLMPNAPRRPVPTRVVLWDEDGLPMLTKRGKVRTLAKSYRVQSTPAHLDAASRLWLEWRYGWTPLVMDLVDSLKAVFAADLRKELVPRDIYVSRSQEKASASVPTSATYVAGGLTYYGSRTTDFEYSIRAYIHYRWAAPDGVLRRMNDFGLFDVPRAVWEVVPFSFLADRVIPIGEWLGAMTPKIGVEIIDMGHTVTQKATVNQKITGVPAINPPGAEVSVRYTPACPVGSEDSYTVLTAERFTYLKTPYLPPIDVRIGIKQMVDVAALFKSIR